MASYNWWRRRRKRKTLKKSAPLLDRIEHGDFEQSQYLREAEHELERMKHAEWKIRKEGREKNWGEQTIRHDIREQRSQYNRRYNHLMKDFFRDEDKILNNLKKGLKKEFNDYWEYLYQEWLDDNLDDLTIEELYNEYKLLDKVDFEV